MKAIRFFYTLSLWGGCAAWACTSLAGTGKDGAAEDSVKPALASGSGGREYLVKWEELQWFDTGRGRQVPVKIYYPGVGEGPFPVVLFSPGLGRSREDCAYLGEHWAGRGYASVYVEHLGSNEMVWRGKMQRKKHLKEAYENPATMRNRPQDMLFALDQLERLKGEGDAVAGRMDFTRVGAAGYDLGAETVLALAGQVLSNGMTFADNRIRAMIAMSPPVIMGQVSLDVAYKDIHVPCLYITGSEDNGIIGTTKAYQRRIPYDNSSGADEYLAVFLGGDHLIYAGPLRPRDSGKDTQFQPYIRDACTLFWDAYLQGKPESIAALRGAGLNAILGSTASVEKKLEADKVAN